MSEATKEASPVERSRSSPLEIVDFEPDTNLRTVCWNQLYLERVKKKYSLEHRQAVIFSNVSQDRFRLVACFFGMAVLMLPPIDPEDRISLYLKVSQFLRQFHFTRKELLQSLDSDIETSKERLERRARLAKKALENKGRRKK